MKRFITGAVLLIVLAFTPCANAFVPLLLPYIIASLTLHTAAIGAIIYYMTAGTTASSVTANGNIARGSSVTYIDLTMSPPGAVTKGLNANMTTQQLLDIVHANESNYPTLTAALKNTNNVMQLNPGSQVGDYVTFPYTNGVIGLVSNRSSLSPIDDNPALYLAVSSPNNEGGTLQSRTVFGGHNSGGNGLISATKFYYNAVSSVPPPTPCTAAQAPKKLAADNTSGDLKANLKAELDKAYQDPSYVPSFSDATTGLPYADPHNVASNDAVNSYNAHGAANDAAAAAATAADAASTTAAANAAAAGATAASAKAVSDAAAAAAAANPGDAGLAAAAAAAKAASDAASAAKQAADNAAAAAAAAAAKTKADAAEKAAEDTSVYSPGALNTSAYGGTAPGDISARFSAFLASMRATSLFSLPSQMIGSIPGGGSSVVSFTAGRFGAHSYDFSTWGAILTTLKAIVMVICGISAVKIVTLKGGGG